MRLQCDIVISKKLRQGCSVILLLLASLFSNSQSTIDLTRPVGMTAGIVGNNGMGGGTYVLPISIPAGTKGVQPQVSIKYSSQNAGNGYCGYGWTASAISMISRKDRNNFNNGTTSPVDYTGSNDIFELDGQRLILVSGINGAAGSSYGVEQENFSKIDAIGGNGNSPDNFLITTTNGTKLEYGTSGAKLLTNDSTQIMHWFLKRLTDPSGNYTEYNYTVDNAGRYFRLDNIQYTGNANNSVIPQYKIEFNYTTKTDWQSLPIYLSGASLYQHDIVSQISVKKADGTPIRSYSFAYEYRQKKYFLKSVTEAGADGTTLNPVNFSYGQNTSGPDVSVTPQYSGFTPETYAGDFDGDGTQDIQTYSYSVNNTTGEKWYNDYAIVGDFSSYSGQPAISFKYQYNMLNDIPNTKIKIPGSATAQNFFSTSDYDGDGKEDVLLAKFNTDFTFQGVNINYSRYYSIYSGPGYKKVAYDYVPLVAGTQYKYFKNGGRFFVSGDFDGDGNVDYILLLSNNTGNNFKAFMSTPAKVAFNTEIVNFGVNVNGATGAYASYKIAEAKAIIPLNFDSDGKTDLLVVRDEGSYVLSISGNGYGGCSSQVVCSTASIKTGYKIFPGDFNGDGNTDILLRPSANDPNAQWKIMYSTGKTFNEVNFTNARKIYLDGDGYSQFHLLTVGDFDRDGKADIFHSVDEGTGGATHYLYYSNGQSFTTEQYTDTTQVNSELICSTADINGDGKPDILSMRNDVSANTYKMRFVIPRPFKEQNLLTSVNTLGYATNISYAMLNGNGLSSGTVYTRSVGNEYDDPSLESGGSPYIRTYAVPKIPMYVVNNIMRPNGLGGQSNEQYGYEDLVLHKTGRGILGFKKIKVTGDMGITNTSTFAVNAPLSTLYTLSQTSAYNNQLLNSSLISTSFYKFSTDQRFFTKTDRVFNINYLTNSASETLNTYDASGNIIQLVERKGLPDDTGSYIAAILQADTIVTSYGTYAGAPYPSFPVSVTTKMARTGQPVVSKTTNSTYTSQGLPGTVTDFVNTSVTTTTTNVYNSFGLPVQITTNAPGVTTPVTTFVYDNTSRFLLEKNVAGDGIVKKEKITYDDKWGVPLTTTSTDGLVTSYVYNTFGELTQTNLPDGTVMTASKSWETTGNNRYSITTQMADGSSPRKAYFDILGREVKSEIRGFGNQWITSVKTYNNMGQLVSETAPYYVNEPLNTTTYTYDNYGRNSSITNIKGTSSVSYSIAGGMTYTEQTTNAVAQSFSKTYDAAGKLIATTENGIPMGFTYDSWGNQLTASSIGDVFVTNVYDSVGRRISQNDINAGTFTYKYNSIGQLIEQKDNNNVVQSVTYDMFGRIKTTTGPQGVTTFAYYYDAATGAGNNNLTQVVGFNGDLRTYQYDNLKRVTGESITVNGSSLSKTYEYDARGHLSKTTYPAGFTINDIYDDNGILIQTNYINGTTTKPLFTATAMNSRGVYTGYNTGNGRSKSVTWDFTKEAAVRYFTAGIQNLNLTYQPNTMNLLTRVDSIKNLTEQFTFDNFDRLTSAKVNGSQQFAITYDTWAQGKMTQKTDIGNYIYSDTKIHQVKYLTPISSGADPNVVIGTNQQNITYTAYHKTETVTENGYQLTYGYGYDYQRLTSELKQNGTVIETKSYWGIMEGITKNGVNSEIYYINAGNGLNNIIVKQNNTIAIYYTYTDQLGSIVAVTNEAGTTIAEQNFDAWGRKRNPADWSYSGVPAVPDWLYRGFTGHEQRPEFSLINMNGRMYDPKTGQMLSPDNFVQNMGSPGAYNRYQYANGNPLKYIDPSGWLAMTKDQMDRAINNLLNGNGGKIDDNGSSEFPSSDAGFGWGVGWFTNNGLWGAYGGGAWSPGQALRNYNSYTGGSGVTADMWNGYMQATYGTLQYNFNTVNATSTRGVALFNTSSVLNGYAINDSYGLLVSSISIQNAFSIFLDNNVQNNGFWKNNWKDASFLVNDFVRALKDGSSFKIANRYNLPTTSVQLPFGLTTRVSTKVVNFVSKVGKPIAMAAPWVSLGAVAANVIANQQITAGDAYQVVVTGLSMIPGAGLIVGGSALALEGMSYLFTGKSVSDNINKLSNGGTIIDWR